MVITFNNVSPLLDPPEVTLTETVNTSCEVEANPPAKLLWSVDGVTRPMMGITQLRPGAAVRCLAENPLGVATAENTEMRIRGLEQRLGQLEERVRTGARLLEDISNGQEQIRDIAEATEKLKRRISDLEENMTAMDKEEEGLLKGRTELIKMLESRIEVIEEFQRRHIGSNIEGQCDSSLAKMADFLQTETLLINSKLSELDAQVMKLHDKVADMDKEPDIPIIDIKKFLGHSKGTISVQAASSTSSGSQKDHHGLFFSMLIFVLNVALIL